MTFDDQPIDAVGDDVYWQNNFGAPSFAGVPDLPGAWNGPEGMLYAETSYYQEGCKFVLVRGDRNPSHTGGCAGARFADPDGPGSGGQCPGRAPAQEEVDPFAALLLSMFLRLEV